MTVAILLLACLVLAGAVVALAVAMRRLTARLAELETRSVRAGQEALDGLETGAGAPSSASETGAGAPSVTSQGAGEREYVITRIGREPDEPAPTLEAKLFADLVLRESVVKAASWAYGVRRGLSPANRNRIWFEMRREIKRARKQRKAEEREAIREWRARQRAAVEEESAA